MGIFNKSVFKSSIPEKFQNLTLHSMTDEIMDEIISSFPEIKTPKFIDIELEKGHISQPKAKELKKKAIIHGIDDYMKKEKEEFDKENSIRNKLKTTRKVLVSVYESEYHGIISKEETDFLVNTLK